MLQKSTLDFLKNLKKNNNKEWLDQNRILYEFAKADFSVMVNGIIQYLSTIDAAYGNLEPKNCIFRVHRDVRFSKDKSPYKTNFGAAFHIGGKKSWKAAFYFHLEPGNSFIGGGLWLPEGDILKKVRQEIDYHFDDFKKIVDKKEFINTYGILNDEDKLKNAPKGYETDNKAIEYLKLKSFTVGQKMKDNELTSKDLQKKMHENFGILAPFIQFLNNAIAD